MSVTPETLGYFPVEDCALERPVLRDPELQAEFDRKGYVVVPFLSREKVAELYDGYVSLAESDEGLNPPGAYNDTYAEFSIIHSHPHQRRKVFQHITSVLAPRADDYLVDYRPLIANYVNKPPGTGVVPAHQNFAVVDERRFQSVSVWVALVDCTVANGAMLMHDGSHTWLRGRRGMWAYQAMHQIEEPLLESYLVPLHVKAGYAVILDDSLVHYSPPNVTDERRLAIQFVMVPKEADALFYQQVGEHDGMMDVDVWKVDEEFFFDFWHGDGDADHGKVIQRVEIPVPHMTPRTLWELMPQDQRPLEPPPEAPVAEEAPAAAPDEDDEDAFEDSNQSGTESDQNRVSVDTAEPASAMTQRSQHNPPRRRRFGFLRGRR